MADAWAKFDREMSRLERSLEARERRGGDKPRNRGKQNAPNIEANWPGDEPNDNNVIPLGMYLEPPTAELTTRRIGEDASALNRAFGREPAADDLPEHWADWAEGDNAGGDFQAQRRALIGSAGPLDPVAPRDPAHSLMIGEPIDELPTLEEARANTVRRRIGRLDEARFGLEPGTLGFVEPAVTGLREAVRDRDFGNALEGLSSAILADPSTGRRDPISRRNYDRVYGAPWGANLPGEDGLTDDQRASRRLADQMDPSFLGEDEITITASSRPERFGEAVGGLLAQDSWETPEARQRGLAEPFRDLGDLAADIWTMPGRSQEEQAAREAGLLFDYSVSGSDMDLRAARQAAGEYGFNAASAGLELTPVGLAGDLASLGRVGARGVADALPARRLGETAPRAVDLPAPRDTSGAVDAEIAPPEPTPARRFEAALRDPETGEIYTGVDHVDAIESAPDGVRERLDAIYRAPSEDPNAVGFVVNGQFMSREEGLQALRAQRAPRQRPGGEVLNWLGHDRLIRNPTEADLERLAELGDEMKYVMDTDGNVYAFSAADAHHNNVMRALRNNGVTVRSLGPGAEVTDPDAAGFIWRNKDGSFAHENANMVETGPYSAFAQRTRGQGGVRIGEQVNRDGSVTERDPIDWDAPIAPERSALADMGIGRGPNDMQPPSINSAPEGNVPSRRLGEPDAPDAGAGRGGNAYLDDLRAQGFDVETPYYHGTQAQIGDGGLRVTENAQDGGIWLSGEPETANGFAARPWINDGYGGQVMPVYVRGRFAENMKPSQARAEGYDGVRGRGRTGETLLVFDPSNIVSRYGPAPNAPARSSGPPSLQPDAIEGAPRGNIPSPRAQQRPWTEADIARAQEMRAEGATVRAIGEELGRAPGDVSRRLNVGLAAPRARGFDPRLSPDEGYAAQRRLAGLTPAQIADEMELPAGQVRVALYNARRKAPDLSIPSIAIGAGIGGAVAFGDEAFAQMAGEDGILEIGGLEIDTNGELPSMRDAVGAPVVSGDLYVQEFSDGSRHVFRMNRNGDRPTPEYLGSLVGTSYEVPRVGEGGATFESGMASPEYRPQAEPRAEGDDLLQRMLPAAAVGLGGRLIGSRLGARGAARDLWTIGPAATYDVMANGSDDLAGTGIAAVAPALSWRLGEAALPAVREAMTEVAPLRAPRLDAELEADPRFLARRRAFANDLEMEAPRARVSADENLEEGAFMDAPHPDRLSPYSEFVNASPVEQLIWMDRLGFDMTPDPSRVAAGREVQRRIGEPVPTPALPAPEGAPQRSGPPPMNRRFRATLDATPPRTIAQRAGSRPAREVLNSFAESYGIPVGRSNVETAANIKAAAQRDARIRQAMKDWGMAAIVGALGLGAVATQDASAAN
jgi:hypothetical protein